MNIKSTINLALLALSIPAYVFSAAAEKTRDKKNPAIALLRAVSSRNDDWIETILENNHFPCLEYIENKHGERLTFIALKAEDGDPSMLIWLLEAGIDLSVKHNKTGLTLKETAQLNVSEGPGDLIHMLEAIELEEKSREYFYNHIEDFEKNFNPDSLEDDPIDLGRIRRLITWKKKKDLSAAAAAHSQ